MKAVVSNALLHVQVAEAGSRCVRLLSASRLLELRLTRSSSC